MLLWVDKILHHLESMVETTCLFSLGIIRNQGF